jgi:MFS family permease
MKININKHKFLKYALFADLYFPEGIIGIIIPVLIPIYLLDRGISVEIATIVGAIGWIPWIIKFAWSGIIDKYHQKGRKLFVIIGSLIAVICFFILAFIDPGISIIPFAIFLFVSQIGQSFHDSAADAWAIDISQIEERGKINGTMAVGHTIGTSTSAVILSFLAESYGFNSIFIMAGLMILIILIIPFIIEESKIEIKKSNVTSLLLKEFGNRTTQLVALFSFFAVSSGGLFMFAVPLFAKNILNLSISQIGLIAGASPLVVIPGGLIGGVLSDRWGRKKTYYALAIPSIIVVMSILFTRSLLLLIIPYFINIFLQTGRGAAARAMYMDATNPKIGATQYSIFNCLSNLSVVISGIFAGFLISLLGFKNVFIVIGMIIIIPVIILYFIKLKNQQITDKILKTIK